MRVDKVILRAALSTLAATVILFACMLGGLCLFYPSTMMNITYDLGMDASAVHHATRAYKRLDDVSYIAFATEVSIGMEDYEKIKTCGWQFIEDDGFGTYCQEKNAELPEGAVGTYEQYIYGQVCCAEYRVGDKTKAVEEAFGAIGTTFPQNNAVVAVMLVALRAEDETTINLIKTKMTNEIEGNLSGADLEYYNQVTGLIFNG